MSTLGPRFPEALVYAERLHHGQTRKGTEVPYVSHLLAVAALVLESGGDETEAVAALLHDALEDCPGLTSEADINARFGSEVAAIVVACSDTTVHPKPRWRERKTAYLEHLRVATPSALRVTAADKLHNTRAMLHDYRRSGEALWKRFNAGRDDQLWYLHEVADTLLKRNAPLALDVSQVVAELQRHVDARAGDGRCPSCAQDSLRPVVYGLPTGDAFEAADRGEVVLGGGMVDGVEPDLRCRSCGATF